MNLNRLGSGKKLINMLVNKGNIKNMGWTPQQQQKLLDNQKNVHNSASRKTIKK
jgi:hypothetical protein